MSIHVNPAWTQEQKDNAEIINKYNDTYEVLSAKDEHDMIDALVDWFGFLPQLWGPNGDAAKEALRSTLDNLINHKNALEEAMKLLDPENGGGGSDGTGGTGTGGTGTGGTGPGGTAPGGTQAVFVADTTPSRGSERKVYLYNLNTNITAPIELKPENTIWLSCEEYLESKVAIVQVANNQNLKNKRMAG